MVKQSWFHSRRLPRKAVEVLNQVNGWRLNPRDAVVINGFWRSGTTWLQELVATALGAKTVFEPFMLSAGYIRECLPEIRPSRREDPFINALMPYVPDDFTEGSRIRAVVERALRGQLARAHISTIGGPQPSFRECLRGRVVVKFTRGALILRAVARAFSPRILHLYRDPRAVVMSLKGLERGRWAGGAFHEFPLRAHLLEVDDGRRAYFSRWTADIEAIEKTNDYGRLAAYYCLTERFLMESMADQPKRFATLRYEDLATDGPAALKQSFASLGLELASGGAGLGYRRRSSTDFGGSKQTGTGGLAPWRDRIDPKDLGLVEEVVTTFGLAERLGPR